MLGIADAVPENWISQDSFEAEVTWLINQFLNITSKPKVYVCLPPPMFCDNNLPSNIHIFNNNVIPGLKNVINSFKTQGINNIQVIDTNSSFLDKYGNPNSAYASYFPDCLHPNKEGLAIIAKAVYQAIT